MGILLDYQYKEILVYQYNGISNGRFKDNFSAKAAPLENL